MVPPAVATSSDRRPGVLRRAFADAVHFDRAAVAPLDGVRVGIGVALVLVVGLAAGNLDAAVSMASGAILVGTASLSGGARPPLVRMLLATGVMASVTFIGSVSGQVPWLHFGLLAPTCLAAGMLGSLGNTPAMVGNQAVIAFVVYGRFAEPGPVALELAAYVIAGGLVEIALSVGFHWPVALKAQREALAHAFDALADLAGSGAGGTPTTGLTAGTALDDAQLALTSPVLFGHSDVTALLGLIETGRRVRIELVVLGARLRDLATEFAPGSSPSVHGSSGAPPGPDRNLLIAAESALHGAQAALQSMAVALRTGAAADTDGLDRAVPRVAEAARHPSVAAGASGLAASVAERVAALAGQLRAARGLVEDAKNPGRRRTRVAVGHPAAPLESPFATAVDTLVANLTLSSTTARHALRLTVVVMLGEWLAYHTPLQRGYWVAFTAALVLRPDFTATFTRGFARVMGTVVGVGVAGLVVAISGADHVTAVILVSILIAAGAATFQASYAVYTLFITGAIVLLLSFITGGAWHTAGDRLLDTLIGGALALLAYALWPSWSEQDARRALVALVQAQRAYLAAVLGVAGGGSGDEYDEAAAGGLARRTRLARVNAQAAVGRSLSEPAAHQLAGGQAILATMQRIGVSVHALRSDRGTGPALGGAPAAPSSPAPSSSAPPLPASSLPASSLPAPSSAASSLPAPSSAAPSSPAAAAPAASSSSSAPAVQAAVRSFAAGIDTALGTIEHALSGDAPPGAALPPLRRLHDDLAVAVEQSETGRPVLVGETDEVVDAVDTLAQLVGVPA